MFCVDLVHVDAYFVVHTEQCLEVNDVDWVTVYTGGAPFGVATVSFIVHFV